jgi:hypothetical protein
MARGLVYADPDAALTADGPSLVLGTTLNLR